MAVGGDRREQRPDRGAGHGVVSWPRISGLAARALAGLVRDKAARQAKVLCPAEVTDLGGRLRPMREKAVQVDRGDGEPGSTGGPTSQSARSFKVGLRRSDTDGLKWGAIEASSPAGGGLGWGSSAGKTQGTSLRRRSGR